MRQILQKQKTEQEIERLIFKEKMDRILSGATAGTVMGAPFGPASAFIVALFVAGIGYYLVTHRK